MVGNIPNYHEYDVLRVFLSVEEGKSRAELAKNLELGEGTVRTILDILKSKGIIASTKQGHGLTNKGRELKIEYHKQIGTIKPLKLKELNPLFKRAAVIKKISTKKRSFELRDIAIRNQAEGALILVYDKDLEIPRAEVDFFKDFRKSYEEILNTFDINPGNTLVVVFAKSANLATNALLAVVSEMNTKIKNLQEFLANSSLQSRP